MSHALQLICLIAYLVIGVVTGLYAAGFLRARSRATFYVHAAFWIYAAFWPVIFVLICFCVAFELGKKWGTPLKPPCEVCAHFGHKTCDHKLSEK